MYAVNVGRSKLTRGYTFIQDILRRLLYIELASWFCRTTLLFNIIIISSPELETAPISCDYSSALH